MKKVSANLIDVNWKSLMGKARDDALRYLPSHLLAAKHWNVLFDLLTDPNSYLPARIARIKKGGDASWPSLMEDYWLSLNGWPLDRIEQRQMLQDVHRVLSREEHRLIAGETSVNQVLYNGLSGFWDEYSELGKKLRQTADATTTPWIRHLKPVTDRSPLIRTISGLLADFSPAAADGRYWLATGSRDGTACLYNPDTGECIHVLKGHTNKITSLAFSSMHPWLVTGSTDGTARLWNTDSGDCLQVFTGHHMQEITAIAFCPELDADNRALFVTGGGDGCACLWDPQRGLLQTFTNHVENGRAYTAVALSPPDSEGRYWLATGGKDNTTCLWDLATGRCLHEFAGYGQTVHLAFSPRNTQGDTWLAVGGYGGVRLWNPRTGDLIKDLDFKFCFVTGLAFTPLDADQCTWLITGDRDGGIRLWNPQTGDCKQVISNSSHVQPYTAPSFAFTALDGKNGIWLAAKINENAFLWNLHTGNCLCEFHGHGNQITSLNFSPPDAKNRILIATASEDHTVRIWDPHTEMSAHKRANMSHASEITSFVFSPPDSDGCTWFSTGNQLWDARTGKCVKNLSSHEQAITAVAFSPSDAEGKIWLATGSEDRTTRLWDTRTGDCIQTFKGHKQEITAVAFSQRDASGSYWLATASRDGTARLWDPVSGDCLHIFGGTESSVIPITTLAFSPPDADGGYWLAIGGKDGRCPWIGDPSTGEYRMLDRHDGGIDCLVFSKTDRESRLWLAAWSEIGTAGLWDIKRDKYVNVFSESDGKIRTIAFSPLDTKGETWFATGNWNGIVRIFNLRMLRQKAVFENRHAEFRSLHFDPSGQVLWLVYTDALARWNWQANERPLFIDLPNLQTICLDSANPNDIIAACLDPTNHRPVFHPLRLENFR
ncbi:WD40 repeat-containing protein [Thiorhodococcus drewsii AZ1]|uniref:WD40 repeat-containing protein n=1 Tax=Thiorhodococcus drewsii AZ1 TaxID=765913 RepID=G2DYP2_9GAMM|nr:WD40 repeat domain-containing protein [Thiorhodococcus drewsii]EGV32669.1 WD40 repeat-containing protein [Thiorhodococcus drewsii AZ1]